MIIPKKIIIGDTQYDIKKRLWLFNKNYSGKITYSCRLLEIRESCDKNEQDYFFHELAHGVLKELEFNHPKIIRFRNNEEFVQEIGLILRKSFLDLMQAQKTTSPTDSGLNSDLTKDSANPSLES